MRNDSKALRIYILSSLFKSRGSLDSFTLYKRAKVGFQEFSSAVLYLIDKGLISEDEYEISLTQAGKVFVQTGSAGGVHKGRKWRKVPKEMEGNRLPPDNFYIPKIKSLDKKTFKFD